MKYINAAEILPKELLIQIQNYVSGEVLYIPSGDERLRWGEKNGSKQYYEARNQTIKELYQSGWTIVDISQEYGLAYETVRKIVYSI